MHYANGAVFNIHGYAHGVICFSSQCMSNYAPLDSVTGMWPTVTVIVQWLPMMTSSNGNILRVTGHLCGEFTGHRWIPHTKASDAELWRHCNSLGRQKTCISAIIECNSTVTMLQRQQTSEATSASMKQHEKIRHKSLTLNHKYVFMLLSHLCDRIRSSQFHNPNRFTIKHIHPR